MRLALALLTIALAGSASAGDRAPLSPEDAVRACPGHGPGFFQIPGSSTCIRIGGRVVTEYEFAGKRAAREPFTASRVRGEVTLDSRTDTDSGPLRLVWRQRVDSWGRAGER